MNLFSALHRLYRRARFGQPIIVVSGLPRSGTSMMMQMLRAGGLEPMSDELREADESNPQGYYEFEKVKQLNKGGDRSWLAIARGRSVKIIAYLLRYLPESYNYQVIFMHRDLNEVLASQAKMLARRGESADTDGERMLEVFAEHVAKTKNVLRCRSCFRVLHVDYDQVVRDPITESSRVNAFLGGRLDVARMAAAVNPELYRNRR